MRRCASALLVAAACGGSIAPPGGPGIPGGPLPPALGMPSARSETVALPPGTTTVTTSDGASLTIILPVDATGATLEDAIISTAPSTVGMGYRLGPSGLTLSSLARLVFTPPTGFSVADLAVATQATETLGYWYLVYGATRDAGANTITVDASGPADFTLVSLSAQQDLSGTFQLQSAQGVNFAAQGNVTLRFLGADTAYSWYLPVGTITMTSATQGGTTCTPLDPAMQELPASIAETKQWTNLEWGINASWRLDCGGTPAFASTNFDSLGITNIGCARSSSGVVSAVQVQQTYSIDCGGGWTVMASWDLAAAAP